jgi:hypothetical protein
VNISPPSQLLNIKKKYNIFQFFVAKQIFSFSSSQLFVGKSAEFFIPPSKVKNKKKAEN